MPAIPFIVMGGIAVAQAVYQHKQDKKAAQTASGREVSAAQIADSANRQAFALGREQLGYDRWLTQATQASRQTYMDMLSGGGGHDYSPGHYDEAKPFVAPTREAAKSEAGYDMTVDAGDQALANSAASRTTAFTGNTLGALQTHGREMAASQYDQVYARAIGAYAQREALRGQAFDRTAKAGFDAAQIGTQADSARLGNVMSLAQLAGPGHYPGEAATMPVLPGGPNYDVQRPLGGY
jgi:hypothetical protein